MHKIDVIEIRILMLVCGKIRKNKIRNECFREHLEVASIGDIIIEIHFKWFVHVQHRSTIVRIRKRLIMQLDDH